MIQAWLLKQWARFGAIITQIGVFLTFVLGLFLFGKHKGKQAEAIKNKERDAKRVEKEKEAVQKIDEKHKEVREKVEEEIADMPSISEEPTKIQDAPKDTVHGKLSSWTRD